MEDSVDRHPSGTEMSGTSEGRPSPGAPPSPESETDQQESLHDSAPASPPGGVSCLTDMDCPVCFSRYDVYRLPKELSCKHNFCAACLKLLTCNELGAWRVICPICRAPTPVFGGLVCTLPNQESMMSRLENPKPKVEPSGSPELAVSLDHHGRCDLSDDEPHGNLRMAARRLVILLLILLILLIIILHFLYTGIMKWVLGFTLGVVMIITVLLCINPYCKVRLSSRAESRQKDNEVVSTV
ncbi:E3 ubiquitin-protein ligase RNF186 [Anomaloglossus baeobatrachus]|uniref:E3 ubiquitin-protein ligase RNF186 n=1 Tax=Anomaloglossus baeobatrachus TaxID=238106 RepID=UPI003F4F5113